MAVKESYAGKINRKLNKKLHVIEVAAGRRPADLVLKNATYVNVFSNELCQADIAVAEGLIVGMGEYHGNVEVDVSGKTESKTAQAQMLILELLADGKRMPSAELEKTVNERGISSRTMRTAKSRIGDRLVTEKDGTAWVCYLRD